MLRCAWRARSGVLPPISRMPKNTTSAVASREKPLNQSASWVGSAQCGTATPECWATLVRADRPSAARIGVMPYVVIRVSWLDTSICDLGSRLGTAASLAGTQIRVTDSPMNVAIAAQVTVVAADAPSSGTSGIEP